MSERLRTKLARFVIRSCIAYSICMGLLPFKLNTTARKLERSRVALVYSVCLNIAFIGILFVTFPTEKRQFNIEFLQRKALNGYIHTVQISISLLSVVFSLYKKWSCSTRMMHAFDDLIRLEREHLAKYCVAPDCARFDMYATAKGCMNVIQLASLLYVMYGINPNADLKFVVTMCLVGLLQNILSLTQSHFYFSVLYVYRNFWLLNRRLRVAVADERHWGPLSQQRHGALADQVTAMTGIYLRLLRVSGELSAVFEYPTLLIAASTIAANIQNLFFILVLLGGKVQLASIWTFMSLAQIVVVNLVDFWLLIAVCERTVEAAARTPLLLRRFNEFADLDVRLSRQIDAFAQLCCSEKMRFRLCGMLDLSHRTGHNVFAATILYLIVLVQFDFMNL